jgi:hypothetical protein
MGLRVRKRKLNWLCPEPHYYQGFKTMREFTNIELDAVGGWLFNFTTGLMSPIVQQHVNPQNAGTGGVAQVGLLNLNTPTNVNISIPTFA